MDKTGRVPRASSRFTHIEPSNGGGWADRLTFWAATRGSRWGQGRRGGSQRQRRPPPAYPAPGRGSATWLPGWPIGRPLAEASCRAIEGDPRDPTVNAYAGGLRSRPPVVCLPSSLATWGQPAAAVVAVVAAAAAGRVCTPVANALGRPIAQPPRDTQLPPPPYRFPLPHRPGLHNNLETHSRQ